jgi:hypothetical protein
MIGRNAVTDATSVGNRTLPLRLAALGSCWRGRVLLSNGHAAEFLFHFFDPL